jgi:hypothetical protein
MEKGSAERRAILAGLKVSSGHGSGGFERLAAKKRKRKSPGRGGPGPGHNPQADAMEEGYEVLSEGIQRLKDTTNDKALHSLLDSLSSKVRGILKKEFDVSVKVAGRAPQPQTQSESGWKRDGWERAGWADGVTFWWHAKAQTLVADQDEHDVHSFWERTGVRSLKDAERYSRRFNESDFSFLFEDF